MIHVELITPEKLVFKDEVDFVAAPGVDGEVGILPHHAPLLSQLAAGELRLKTGETTRSVAVSGGFIEVRPESHVEIFAETAEFAEEIDVARANQAAEKAKSQLAAQNDLTAAEVAELEASLTRAILRVKIGNLRRHKSGAPQPHN
jgi:F-type H+-transporting ATPase subunit epsilon